MLDLVGEAHDYVGKSLSGGRIIVRPTPDFRSPPEDNIIVGNTALYGAIEGEAFFSGVAGERFAVRNSGCVAVAEGIGDHGCEYMTGGTVVVLGDMGRNFAAGMSGGIAYVYSPTARLESGRCHSENVTLEPVLSTAEQLARTGPAIWHKEECDEVILKVLLEKHVRFTDSPVAKKLLADWEHHRKHFVKVFTKEYQYALIAHAARGKATLTAISIQ